MTRYTDGQEPCRSSADVEVPADAILIVKGLH